MARIPKKIICLATVVVILCAYVPAAHAEALPNVLEGSATLADNIMSYYALSGSAVANTDWINTLYDSYGSSFGTIYDFAENGMLTLNNDGTWQATTALETAIENAPAYQSLGLDQIFNVSAQEAAAGGGIAASGAATLAGSLAGVASTGVLPLFGGVTASYWAGIGIGNIIAHKLDLYGENILASAPITLFDVSSYTNNMLGGDRLFYIHKTGQVEEYHMLSCDTGVYVSGYTYISRDKNCCNIFTYNTNNYSSKYRDISADGTYFDGSIPRKDFINPIGGFGYGEFFNGYKVISFPNKKSDMSAVNNEFNNWRNGQNIPSVNNYSPDMVGSDGNLSGEKDQEGNITVPNMLPQIDPGVQSGKPLTLQDWLNFANSVKNNNSNTNPLPDNKALFDDLINAIKKAIPNPNPNPDPNPDPDPDPYHPPTPTPVPDPDYGDPNPDQPDFESETDIPDPVDTGNPWVTPNLLDKFPFCIPKDMIDVLKGFKSADRAAPHISWNFKSPVGNVDYTFNLDLEDFEDVATLLRALELAAFIVGLAFATRYLIGAS